MPQGKAQCQLAHSAIVQGAQVSKAARRIGSAGSPRTYRTVGGVGGGLDAAHLLLCCPVFLDA